ncbi:Fic family protein [Paenibacillus sp. MZ04-78.2]|uniref:Fic/DOC family protein n=1 Tax=Paenibacillus sp. MZ04-78.2 TaxID=2962034 RepID=UPI0020B6F03E|nr:Fic family protein [Paenibacillus sp. MZ04-78.2]MCP3776106.1 Fic family protein [Paenibacillus sp. MZ04-78.2]
MNDFVQSKYCYPGTDVLINYAGIRDEEQLKVFESIVTANRLAQLILTPTPGNFDLTHLKSIHHHIFQDVYPFAGKLRAEDIAKDTFRFAPTQFLESSAADLFRDLAKEKFLKDLPMADFAKRVSHYMAEINVLHPFREGNGRAQREFIRQLAVNAGYQLDWSRVDKSLVMQASIRSKVDTQDLSDVIGHCLEKMH